VGGFGICDVDDLLLVKDIAIVKQKVSVVTVAFDDDAVADFFEDQVEAGRKPEQFARIWIHCHPGDSPEPSHVDEETFQRVFGTCDWSIMAIVAQDNSTYARLHFNVGPGGDLEIPIHVEYDQENLRENYQQWKSEYIEKVTETRLTKDITNGDKQTSEFKVFGHDESESICEITHEDLLMELDAMHPAERRVFLEELSSRCEFWDEYESEVLYE
jgi:hypothetical protein